LRQVIALIKVSVPVGELPGEIAAAAVGVHDDRAFLAAISRIE
jgi:hypothetical protein